VQSVTEDYAMLSNVCVNDKDIWYSFVMDVLLT